MIAYEWRVPKHLNSLRVYRISRCKDMIQKPQLMDDGDLDRMVKETEKKYGIEPTDEGVRGRRNRFCDGITLSWFTNRNGEVCVEVPGYFKGFPLILGDVLDDLVGSIADGDPRGRIDNRVLLNHPYVDLFRRSAQDDVASSLGFWHFDDGTAGISETEFREAVSERVRIPEDCKFYWMEGGNGGSMTLFRIVALPSSLKGHRVAMVDVAADLVGQLNARIERLSA